LALEIEIIREVFVALGMPAQRILPLTVVSPRIHEALRYYNAGLELSTQNQTIKVSAPFSATAIEMAVPASWAFGEAAIVEIAADDAETDWDQIQIVNLDALETYEQSGQRAVAFFGAPSRMRFSWDASLETRRLRVSYDEVVADPQALDAALGTLPDYYIGMVAARVSLDCIPDLMDKAPEREAALGIRAARLTVRLAEWEKKWDWKVNDKHQQGHTSRPAFNRGRSGWGRSSGLM
jgi:hypothetical protein